MEKEQPKTLIDKKIELINKQVDRPMVSPVFGDNWKEYAKTMPVDYIIEIAWRQGRRAILLEEALRRSMANESEESKMRRLKHFLNELFKDDRSVGKRNEQL